MAHPLLREGTRMTTTSTIQLRPDTAAFEARPDGNGPNPGVIVIHEIFGLNDWVRQVATRFADHGFATLAVDLFEGNVPENMEAAGPFREKITPDFLKTRIGAGIEYL